MTAAELRPSALLPTKQAGQLPAPLRGQTGLRGGPLCTHHWPSPPAPPAPPAPASGLAGRGVWAWFPALPGSPPGSSWPHKDTLPSPPGRPCPHWLDSSSASRAFSSVVSGKSIIYKALCTHPAPRKRAGNGMSLEWDPAATAAACKGRGQARELLGPSAEGPISP